MENKEALIIGIAGGSGSGKTTFANKIIQYFGGDVATLNALAGVVDELVVQTYRGRRTEPGYARYLQALTRLTLPFKVGLVQGGEWDRTWESRLADSAAYRGVVVFLINPPGA